MGTTPPTLDYAAASPNARLRKWPRRILLAVLVLACLYAAPIAWLYWGWRQEQPAREMVAQVKGSIEKMELAGPSWVERFIPARLAWIRERIAGVLLLRTAATDDDLRMLRRLSSLEALNLYQTQVTDAGLAHLDGLARLKVLHLTRTQVTDAGLMHLKGHTALLQLALDDMRVTDAGLAYLHGLTQLWRLSLCNTEITDAGLVHLKGLTGLQELYLIHTNVTEAGVADLQKALPQCKIIRWSKRPPPDPTP